MENKIQIFKNKKLNLKMRTIQNSDGSISINVEDTAIGFGWIREKNGKRYVMWDRLNEYLAELGFPQKCGKDDFIPESVFYMLGMKASNKTAQEFQKWLAVEVIPSIRKNGSYQVPKMSKELQAIFTLDSRTMKIESEVKDLKDNMPLFNIDCDELQKEVKRVGVKALGGKDSAAYQDKSVRTKVYTDIQHQVKRQFDVKSYKAIKRCQLEIAKEIINNYKLPFVLEREIEALNNQLAMEEVACTKE